jgi:hypothetical protein
MRRASSSFARAATRFAPSAMSLRSISASTSCSDARSRCPAAGHRRSRRAGPAVAPTPMPDGRIRRRRHRGHRAARSSAATRTCRRAAPTSTARSPGSVGRAGNSAV